VACAARQKSHPVTFPDTVTSLRRTSPWLLASTLAVLAAPGLAAAAETAIPARTLSLTAPASKARTDCGRTRHSGSGVATTTFRAPVTGFYSYRLKGGETRDWDLTVFNPGAKRALSGSSAFGADEVAQAITYAGSTIEIQACRIRGAGATVPLTISGVTVDPSDILPAPAKASLVHVDLPTRGAWELLQSLNIETEEAAGPAGVDAVVEAPQLKLLEQAGLTFRTEIADLAAKERRDRAAEQTPAAKARAAADGVPSGRSDYRDFEDFGTELKQLVADHPGLVKGVTLPKKTFQGRETMGVEISGNVDATDDQKPVSFLMGMHHAREWPAAEIPMEFAIYLAKNYGTDPRVTTLLDTTRIVVVPLVNADGYIASRTVPVDPADATGDPGGAPSLVEGALIPVGGTLAYRRKNCNGAVPSGDVPCTLQIGVDPNRNYGFKWGGPGASTSPGSQSYRGTGPWSETETQAVHEYSQLRDVTTLMTVHTVAALVLRPPGLKVDGQAPDEAPLKKLGDAMAKDTGYTSQYGFELYDTSGTTEDWNYGAAGTFGYTIELGAPGGGFHESYQGGVIDQWTGTDAGKGLGMRSAMLRLAEAATDAKQFSTLKGRAPAGRIIRVKKTFQTATSPICTIAGPIDVRNDAYACISTTDPQLIDDKLDYTTKVPDSGSFSWLVTPSTRPFEAKAGKTEQWTLTCEDTAGKVYETQLVTIGRGETKAFELPCGGTLVPVAGTATGAVKDKLAPVSRFTRSKLKATRRGVFLNGTSRDVAPKGLSPVLKRVAVALGKRTGKLCRFAKPDGSFGPKVSCLRTKYLPAKGTRSWSFVYRHKLPAGKYLAWVRGVDARGNTERKYKQRNLITFRIR